MFSRIKDILFKIKDYDRLEHDYSTCLYYFTNGRLSKTGYEIKTLETLICDTISEYEEEGYNHAVEKAVKWLGDNADTYTWYDEMEGESGMTREFIPDFKNAMEVE